MTGRFEVTRYATPSLRWYDGCWVVAASPWRERVGSVTGCTAGWIPTNTSGRTLGLWPTKQAAAEVLVKQAGYELETT